jgi:integrase
MLSDFLTLSLEDGSLSWKALKACGCGGVPGIDFAGSALVFPGRNGAPFSNKAFNARLKLACQRARVTVISAHPLRHTAATLLLADRRHH